MHSGKFENRFSAKGFAQMSRIYTCIYCQFLVSIFNFRIHKDLSSIGFLFPPATMNPPAGISVPAAQISTWKGIPSGSSVSISSMSLPTHRSCHQDPRGCCATVWWRFGFSEMLGKNSGSSGFFEDLRTEVQRSNGVKLVKIINPSFRKNMFQIKWN